MRASPRPREAMDQADIFRLVLPQNGLSSHILKSRIRDGSPAGVPAPGRFSHGPSLNFQTKRLERSRLRRLSIK